MEEKPVTLQLSLDDASAVIAFLKSREKGSDKSLWNKIMDLLGINCGNKNYPEDYEEVKAKRDKLQGILDAQHDYEEVKAKRDKLQGILDAQHDYEEIKDKRDELQRIVDAQSDYKEIKDKRDELQRIVDAQSDYKEVKAERDALQEQLNELDVFRLYQYYSLIPDELKKQLKYMIPQKAQSANPIVSKMLEGDGVLRFYGFVHNLIVNEDADENTIEALVEMVKRLFELYNSRLDNALEKIEPQVGARYDSNSCQSINDVKAGTISELKLFGYTENGKIKPALVIVN